MVSMCGMAFILPILYGAKAARL